jgi:hypothetical protein
MKSRKRIYIPDVYIGLLVLPVIGIIALITGWALPLVMTIVKFFHHN